jgi:hypothetical protein
LPYEFEGPEKARVLHSVVVATFFDSIMTSSHSSCGTLNVEVQPCDDDEFVAEMTNTIKHPTLGLQDREIGPGRT